MPTLKIGERTTSKLKDANQPYYTIGIARTEEGYELRKLRVLGLEIQLIKVLMKTPDRALILHEMRLQLGNYIIDFNEESMKG